MTWYLYIIFARLFDTAATLLSRKLFVTKKMDAISFVMLNCIITGLMVFVVGLFKPDFGMLPGKEVPWLNLILMMVLYGFGSILFYNGIKRVEASRLAIISASGSVFAMASSALILGEKLKDIQLLGAFIIIAGIIVTNIKKGTLNFGKGELFVLLGSACFGIQVINDKAIMSTMGTYFYLAIAYLAPLILQGGFFPKAVKLLPTTIKLVGKRTMLIYSLLMLGQSICFFEGLALTDSPGLFSMFGLIGRVFLVIMSILILKETQNLKQKIFGTIIVIIGLILLS